MLESENLSHDGEFKEKERETMATHDQKKIANIIRSNVVRWLQGVWKNIRKFTIAMVFSIVLSMVFSILFVRGCWNFVERDYLGKMLCGDIGAELRDFHWLDLRKFAVVSNVPESKEYSIARGTSADKLIDRLVETQAYPAQNEFSYTVDFVDLYEIQEVVMIFGTYGTDPLYLKHWSLDIRTVDGIWENVAEGDFPNKNSINIPLNKKVTAVRVIGEGNNQWVGIYELRVKGRISS